MRSAGLVLLLGGCVVEDPCTLAPVVLHDPDGLFDALDAGPALAAARDFAATTSVPVCAAIVPRGHPASRVDDRAAVPLGSDQVANARWAPEAVWGALCEDLVRRGVVGPESVYDLRGGYSELPTGTVDPSLSAEELAFVQRCGRGPELPETLARHVAATCADPRVWSVSDEAIHARLWRPDGLASRVSWATAAAGVEAPPLRFAGDAGSRPLAVVHADDPIVLTVRVLNRTQEAEGYALERVDGAPLPAVVDEAPSRQIHAVHDGAVWWSTAWTDRELYEGEGTLWSADLRTGEVTAYGLAPGLLAPTEVDGGLVLRTARGGFNSAVTTGAPGFTPLPYDEAAGSPIAGAPWWVWMSVPRAPGEGGVPTHVGLRLQVTAPPTSAAGATARLEEVLVRGGRPVRFDDGLWSVEPFGEHLVVVRAQPDGLAEVGVLCDAVPDTLFVEPALERRNGRPWLSWTDTSGVTLTPLTLTPGVAP